MTSDRRRNPDMLTTDFFAEALHFRCEGADPEIPSLKTRSDLASLLYSASNLVSLALIIWH
jgi:transcriptional regulator of acetoin/glycerol metabolism